MEKNVKHSTCDDGSEITADGYEASTFLEMIASLSGPAVSQDGFPCFWTDSAPKMYTLDFAIPRAQRWIGRLTQTLGMKRGPKDAR